MFKRFKRAHDESNSEFQIDLENFKKKLLKLEFYLNNPLDFIYEECNELKRKVQLNTEESIASIKETNDLDSNTDESELESELRIMVEEILDQNDLMIARIEIYQQESIKVAETTTESKEELLNRIKEIHQSLMDLNASSIINKQTKLDELNIDIKNFIFNNNILEFKVHDETKNGYLYLKQSIDIKTFNQIDLNEHINDQDYNLKCDVLSNKKYLLIYNYNYKQTHLKVYNPILNRIEYSCFLDYPSLNNIKIVNNLIALNCSADYSGTDNYLIILDENLAIQSKKSVQRCFLIGANEKHLFCKEDEQFSSKCLKFDWSLNELESELTFQNQDPKKKFFIETECYSILQLEHRNKHFYVRPGSNIVFLNTHEPAVILDETGQQLSLAKIYGELKFDKNNNLISLKDDKLVYYDLNGEPFKEIYVAGFKNLIIDLNSDIHVFDKFDRKIYFK